jgi:hypothetical protein
MFRVLAFSGFSVPVQSTRFGVPVQSTRFFWLQRAGLEDTLWRAKPQPEGCTLNVPRSRRPPKAKTGTPFEGGLREEEPPQTTRNPLLLFVFVGLFLLRSLFVLNHGRHGTHGIPLSCLFPCIPCIPWFTTLFSPPPPRDGSGSAPSRPAPRSPADSK